MPGRTSPPSDQDQGRPPQQGWLALGTRDLLLVALSLSAGVVDAISITALGVFTGAITGDVVLLGVALGRGEPHDAIRSALALAGFALGVFAALRAQRALARPDGSPPRRGPVAVLACAALLQCGFLALWLAVDGRPGTLVRDALTVLSALAMGSQTAAARTLHPAGPPTTYVTGTLTVLLSELATESGSRADRQRRIAIVVAISGGAALGALTLAHARGAAAAIPPAITVLVALAALKLAPPPPRAVGPGR